VARSASPRKSSLSKQSKGHKDNQGNTNAEDEKKMTIKAPSGLPRKSSLASSSKLNATSSNSFYSSSTFSEKQNHTEQYSEESARVHKFSPIWLAPSESPLDFNHFKQNFQDFSQELRSCSESRQGRSGKKTVSYADTGRYVALGFRVL